MGLSPSCDFWVDSGWPDFWVPPIVPKKSKFFSWLRRKPAHTATRLQSNTVPQHTPGDCWGSSPWFFNRYPRPQPQIFRKTPGFSTQISHFSIEPHPSRQSDNAALVWWSWDEGPADRVLTLLSKLRISCCASRLSVGSGYSVKQRNLWAAASDSWECFW